MFRDAVRRVGQQQNLREFIVVMEPHKKWKPDRSKPEMHFHVVFKMKANFAHLSIAKSLATVSWVQGAHVLPRQGVECNGSLRAQGLRREARVPNGRASTLLAQSRQHHD